MKKIELRIIGLSYSPTQEGSYVLVLAERKGKYKLPIIIKPHDAQYIAQKLEDFQTKRPLTQDLIRKISDFSGVELHKVVITNFLEGVFHARLVFSTNTMVDEFEVDCSIGDAISQALSFGCPIFCNKEIVTTYGFEMEDDGSISDDQYESNHQDRKIKSGVTVESLEKMLEKALENEEYEIASQLRDRISDLKKTQENGL
jgi:uncharacterized protein